VAIYTSKTKQRILDDKRTTSIWQLNIEQTIVNTDFVVQHNFRVYQWLDFAASLGGIVFLAYVVLAYFVPTD